MSASIVLLGLLAGALSAQSVPAFTVAQKEAFLREAKVTKTHEARKGITGTRRATLSDGTTTHDASIQTIDERKSHFQTPQGSEINFQDSYRLNIAAFRLGQLLGLDSMIPVSVERQFSGKTGSFTWWIEDIQMDEVDRLRKKVEAPDKDRWARQTLIMRVFDQLIYNVDRNAGNILYDKNWNLWMIDHSRAFRRHHTLQDRKMLDKCDSELLARIKALNEKDLKEQAGAWLDQEQIKALLIRAKLIVAHFEAAGPSKQYSYLPSR